MLDNPLASIEVNLIKGGVEVTYKVHPALIGNARVLAFLSYFGAVAAAFDQYSGRIILEDNSPNMSWAEIATLALSNVSERHEPEDCEKCPAKDACVQTGLTVMQDKIKQIQDVFRNTADRSRKLAEEPLGDASNPEMPAWLKQALDDIGDTL